MSISYLQAPPNPKLGSQSQCRRQRNLDEDIGSAGFGSGAALFCQGPTTSTTHRSGSNTFAEMVDTIRLRIYKCMIYMCT